MALDETVGGASANTYATVAEATAALALRPGGATTWAATAVDQQEAALAMACLLMDRTLPWDLAVVGFTRLSTAQALFFPRLSTYNASRDAFVTGVPDFVKGAQIEWALQLVGSDRLSDASARGISALSVGPLAITFDTAAAARTYPTPDIIYSLLKPWLNGAGPITANGLTVARTVLV